LNRNYKRDVVRAWKKTGVKLPDRFKAYKACLKNDIGYFSTIGFKVSFDSETSNYILIDVNKCICFTLKQENNYLWPVPDNLREYLTIEELY
jgi:hypothetical protein